VDFGAIVALQNIHLMRKLDFYRLWRVLDRIGCCRFIQGRFTSAQRALVIAWNHRCGSAGILAYVDGIAGHRYSPVSTAQGLLVRVRAYQGWLSALCRERQPPSIMECGREAANDSTRCG